MWGPAEVMKIGKMKKRCEGNFIKKIKNWTKFNE